MKYIGISPFKKITEYVTQVNDTLHQICKFTNKKEQDICLFLKENIIDHNELYFFVSAFGKLPNENQVKQIFSARNNQYMTTILYMYYSQGIEF